MTLRQGISAEDKRNSLSGSSALALVGLLMLFALPARGDERTWIGIIIECQRGFGAAPDRCEQSTDLGCFELVSGRIVYRIRNSDFTGLVMFDGRQVQLTGRLDGAYLLVSRLEPWPRAALAPTSRLREETLSGADAHDGASDAQLLGGWGGTRAALLRRGVKLDLHLISDFLWNAKSQQAHIFAGYNRARLTVDADLETLLGLEGFSFHATPVWQAGFNLGAYLGLIANPTSLASSDTFRLDSWWFEERWLKGGVAVRLGQFAGEDTYGNPAFGDSFVFEPLGGPTDNLFNTFESFDPPSTPAAELRLAPLEHFYIKSMVLAEDRTPYANNPTGLLPRFGGTAVSVSEIGFAPGKSVTSITPSDSVEARNGYTGVYRLGISYDPGEFSLPGGKAVKSGNYLIYAIASQAVWRPDPAKSRGIDATVSYDWSPPGTNVNYTMLTAALRCNEPMPLGFHNTVSLGYVQNTVSPRFPLPDLSSGRTEHGLELNALFTLLPMLTVQPVIQYYADVGGGRDVAIVAGFRTRIEF